MNRWILDEFEHRHQYQAILDMANIPESDYLAAVNELLLVFPRAEAQAYVADVLRSSGSIAASSLHPIPFHRLDHHPVPMMLSLGANFYELIKLGRDLHDTRDIPRVASLRKDLKRYRADLTDFSGKLFELEVLAEFQRAGLGPERLKPPLPDCRIKAEGSEIYVEARHRSSPIGMVVATELMSGMYSIQSIGRIHVHLHRDGLSDSSERQLSRLILDEIRQIVEANPTENSQLARDLFSIDYYPHDAVRSLVVSFGNDTYSTDIEQVVYSSLKDKERQLTRPAQSGFKCLIAVDFRSLVQAVPRQSDSDAQSYIADAIGSWQDSIRRAEQSFLADSSIVAGVLSWWRKDWTELTPEETVFRPDRIRLATRDSDLVIGSSEELYRVCSSI